MANKTIGGLNALVGSLDTDFLVEVETAAGASVRVPLSTLKTWINTNPTVVPSSEPYRGCRLKLTAAESIAASPSEPIITWDAAGRDTDSFWSAGDPTKIVIPSGVTKARLSCSLHWDTTSGNYRRGELLKNGALVEGGFRASLNYSVAGNDTHGAISDVLDVSSGDYFQVRTRQNSGGTRTILADETTWFALEVVEAS